MNGYKYIDKVRTKSGKIRYVYDRGSVGNQVVGVANNIAGIGYLSSLSQYYPHVISDSVHLQSNKLTKRKRRRAGYRRAYSAKAQPNTTYVNKVPSSVVNYGKRIVSMFLGYGYKRGERPGDAPRPHKKQD